MKVQNITESKGQSVTTGLFTGKYALLPHDHPTVLRRLAKALNAHGWQAGRAFYMGGSKWTRARFHKGRLQICVGYLLNWTTVDPLTAVFDDGDGNVILASRTICGH